MPYDVCPLTFAGSDADLIHWEQTYNCGFGDCEMILETFIRQSLNIRSRPILIFADSATPNWREQDCPKDLQSNLTLSEMEMNLYQLSRELLGIKKIATQLNQDIYHKVPCLPFFLTSFAVSLDSWLGSSASMVSWQGFNFGITLVMKDTNAVGHISQIGELDV